MNVYRVEKDGVTFYVQPEQIEFYAANGYTIYKQVEEVVSNVAKEAAAAAASQDGPVVSEASVNG